MVKKNEKIKLSQVEYEYLWHKKNKTAEEKQLLADCEIGSNETAVSSVIGHKTYKQKCLKCNQLVETYNWTKDRQKKPICDNCLS